MCEEILNNEAKREFATTIFGAGARGHEAADYSIRNE